MSDEYHRIVQSFVELKNTSELMMDLAYSSLLLNSRELAEEVLRLEDRVDVIHHDFQLMVLSCSAIEQEPEARLGLIEAGEVTERIADAAAEIAKVILRGPEPHAVLGQAIREAEQTVVKATISEKSILVGQRLKEAKIPENTGMWILAILRGQGWVRPSKETTLQAGDTLIASGYADGEEYFRKMAKGRVRK